MIIENIYIKRDAEGNITGDKMPSGYYLKADVDAIIAQKDFEIDRLKEFTAFIKNRISNGDVNCSTLLDDLEQKDKEIAELKHGAASRRIPPRSITSVKGKMNEWE